MNDIVFIGTIIFLIIICVYIYLTKNQEIDELTKQTSKDTDVGKSVDINDHNNCMRELNSLRINLLETQEENSRLSLEILELMMRVALESQEDLNNLSS